MLILNAMALPPEWNLTTRAVVLDMNNVMQLLLVPRTINKLNLVKCAYELSNQIFC